MTASTLPLALDQFSGRKLGKYEIICRLSTGGMSVIFLAFQRGLAGFRKFVVLKQILPDIVGEEEFVRMFLDEAKITAAFNHPNIAQVYDLDIQSGELFLAMEFIPGATLVEVAKACRANNEPIPTGFSLMAVRDTALALNYAHSFTDPAGRHQTVIHRDVAEKNVMVTYEGTTKLLDFGIAKSLARASRTTVGMVKGTSGYMSPEQILGEKLDARSDIFSLGVVLHECLTGMRLFHGKSAEDGMIAALKEPVAPPSRGNSEVSPELDAVVLKALARKREDRFSSAREFARAIEKAAAPLIWHPEQTAELISRLFSDRREQTRVLMASAETDSEVTGEHMLRQLLGEPPPPPRATGARAQLREVPPPPPAPPPIRKTGAGITVSPAVAPLPSRMKPAPADDDVQIITNTPTPAHRLRTQNLGPSTPWEQELTAEGDLGDLVRQSALPGPGDDERPTTPPRVPAPPPASQLERELLEPVTHGGQIDSEDPEGLTLPVGSVPPEVLEELALGHSLTEAATGSNVSNQGLTEDTTPGSLLPRRRGRYIPMAVFVAIMLTVFGVGLVMTGLHKRLLGSRFDEPVPPQPIPLTEAQLAVPAPPPAAETQAPPPVASPGNAAAVEKEKPKPPPAPPPPAAETRAPTRRAPSVGSRGEELRVEEPEPATLVTPEEPIRSRRRDHKGNDEVPAAAVGAGTLTLVAEPFAKVLYKSQDLGPTPLFKIPLPVGKHTLKLIGADQKTRLLQVDIKDKEPTSLRVNLETLPTE